MTATEAIAMNGVSKELLATTSANAWRKVKEDAGLFRLPGCGHVARLRRLSLIALAAAGDVPNGFSDQVYKMMVTTEKVGASPEEQLKVYKRHAKAMMEVASRVMLSPRLVLDRAPNPDADEIGPEDLLELDYTWFFYTFLNGSAEQVSRFRADSTPGALPE